MISQLNPTPKMNRLRIGLLIVVIITPLSGADQSLKSIVTERIASDYSTLDALYKHLHAHPEQSFMEEKTAERLAAELRAAEYEVTERLGGYGVVAVMKNGSGPTLLIRADMDGLPVAEETGLPYASKVRTKDLTGSEVPVMHACGHDVHMTCLVGTARALARLKGRWSGTLVLIGQPAEERVVGARAMLAAGLYRKFPKPDFAIALHNWFDMAAGTVAFTDGYAMANLDFVDITVRGIGGHGGYPHNTKDPIVLGTRIVTTLQTIVSRETRPIDACVVTVGSFHGGTKHNIIPAEVKLQLALRSYRDEVRSHTLEAVKRICRGEAIAAGIPDHLMPIVELSSENTSALRNDPVLNRRVRRAVTEWLGEENVVDGEPVMGAEDFSEFGRTIEAVPLCYFRIGILPADVFEKFSKRGIPVPQSHSSKYAPMPELTIKTGVAALTAAALNLLSKN
ncbi:MAG: amidohydrolase [Verrucomicrobia bacterium]|nr:amidohydrolase [Verrucomicrobiota bacterium]